jgi:hypothetical protein
MTLLYHLTVHMTQRLNYRVRNLRINHWEILVSPFLIIFFSSTHDMIMNDVVYI